MHVFYSCIIYNGNLLIISISFKYFQKFNIVWNVTNLANQISNKTHEIGYINQGYGHMCQTIVKQNRKQMLIYVLFYIILTIITISSFVEVVQRFLYNNFLSIRDNCLHEFYFIFQPTLVIANGMEYNLSLYANGMNTA